MSFGLLHRFVLWWNANKNIPASSLLKINTAVLGGHLTYTYGTTLDKEIVVKQKFFLVDNGYTKFMIRDSFDQQYCVNNSLWFWKWDCLEDWTKLEEGQSYLVRTYGWRVPILSLFPNIIKLHSHIPLFDPEEKV